MNVFASTTDWIKGELFEGKLVLLFGVLAFVCAILFYKIGTTPNAKAMLFSLVLTGLMFTAIGGGMLYSNSKRLIEFSKAYEDNPTSFLESEKNRVEAFTKWYPMARYIFSALGILGIVLVIFWHKPIGAAIGFGLILVMTAIFVIDHFSEERAATYYEYLESSAK